MSRFLPIFPSFMKLSLIEPTEYNKFIKDFPPYADWSLGNLLLWLDLNDDLEASLLDGCMVIRYTSVLKGNNRVYNILGGEISPYALDKLFNIIKLDTSKAILSEVPSCIVDNSDIDHDKIIVEEDRDSFEYVYCTKEHSELSGSRFSRVRRKVKQFEREYSNLGINIKQSNRLNQEDVDRLLSATSAWKKDIENFNTNSDITGNYEFAVLPRSLKMFNTLGSRLVEIEVGGELVAFAIYRHLSRDGCVTVNHLKYDKRYTQVFDYTTHSLAKILDAENVGYMNYEQDLGVLGMRVHKERLRPCEMLKKYYISEKVVA